MPLSFHVMGMTEEEAMALRELLKAPPLPDYDEDEKAKRRAGLTLSASAKKLRTPRA
jgi:hypothetical protein